MIIRSMVALMLIAFCACAHRQPSALPDPKVFAIHGPLPSSAPTPMDSSLAVARAVSFYRALKVSQGYIAMVDVAFRATEYRVRDAAWIEVQLQGRGQSVTITMTLSGAIRRVAEEQ